MTEQTILSGTRVKRPGLYYGYVIVIASFFTTLVVCGAHYSFGVFFKPLLAEFGWTRAATSGAYSLNFVLQGVFGLFAGRLSDRFGPRVVVTICGLFLGLGYLLMSQVQAIWHIYLFLGVFVGAGACIFVPIMSTATRWFIKRRGLMTGIIAAGIGVGVTIMPPLANQLITSYSWRTSYRILATVSVIVTVSAAQFLKRDPHQLGLAAYGEREVSIKEPLTDVPGLSLRQALHTRQFWLICGILAVTCLSLQTVMVHLVPHATDIGVPAAAAASILSVIGLLSIGSKLGMGMSLDRIGGKWVLTVVLILMAGGFIWLRAASELWMLYLFTIIFTIAYGGHGVVTSPIVAEYFGLKSHGTIFGVVYLLYMIGGASGPLIAGRIFDVTGSYTTAFTVCTVLNLTSLLLLFPLKPIHKN